MYKVIINKCYGGFSLSKAAMKRLLELGYQDNCYKTEEDLKWEYNFMSPEYHIDIKRHDKRLIQVIEELGAKEAGGHFAKLSIEKIDSPLYKISNYDGYESIITQDTCDWIDCRED